MREREKKERKKNIDARLENEDCTALADMKILKKQACLGCESRRHTVNNAAICVFVPLGDTITILRYNVLANHSFDVSPPLPREIIRTFLNCAPLVATSVCKYGSSRGVKLRHLFFFKLYS
jgi:hypothetical protein